MSGAEHASSLWVLRGALLGGITLMVMGEQICCRSVKELPESCYQARGICGELRSYQADALAWINFLDNAGLGGCLALDMGLGKTPTTLANLANTPALNLA